MSKKLGWHSSAAGRNITLSAYSGSCASTQRRKTQRARNTAAFAPTNLGRALSTPARRSKASSPRSSCLGGPWRPSSPCPSCTSPPYHCQRCLALFPGWGGVAVPSKPVQTAAEQRKKNCLTADIRWRVPAGAARQVLTRRHVDRKVLCSSPAARACPRDECMRCLAPAKRCRRISFAVLVAQVRRSAPWLPRARRRE
eukprot:COSAG01_NODE_25401_length_746_cov_1.149923_1_plen_197_part_10